MQTFGPHLVGETWRISVAALRKDNTAGQVQSPTLTCSVDDPTLATIKQNSTTMQVDCALLAPGTATFTVTDTNENGLPFSSQFQIAIVSPVPQNPTDHFDFSESGNGFTNPIVKVPT